MTRKRCSCSVACLEAVLLCLGFEGGREREGGRGRKEGENFGFETLPLPFRQLLITTSWSPYITFFDVMAAASSPSSGPWGLINFFLFFCEMSLFCDFRSISSFFAVFTKNEHIFLLRTIPDNSGQFRTMLFFGSGQFRTIPDNSGQSIFDDFFNFRQKR